MGGWGGEVGGFELCGVGFWVWKFGADAGGGEGVV